MTPLQRSTLKNRRMGMWTFFTKEEIDKAMEVELDTPEASRLISNLIDLETKNYILKARDAGADVQGRLASLLNECRGLINMK